MGLPKAINVLFYNREDTIDITLQIFDIQYSPTDLKGEGCSFHATSKQNAGPPSKQQVDEGEASGGMWSFLDHKQYVCYKLVPVIAPTLAHYLPQHSL